MVDSRWDPTRKASAMPRCRNCGEHVTPQFARVFGDNRNVVEGCPSCLPGRELDQSARR